MASSRKPFMALSDSGPRWRLGKVGAVKGGIPPKVPLKNNSVCWVEHLSPQAADRDIMVGRCPLCRDGFVEHGRYSRCQSGHGPGDAGKEEDEVNSSVCDEFSLGERWFN